MVARKGGTIHTYSLPHINIESKQTVKENPISVYLNCDSTRFACIDVNGHLSLYEINP